MRATYVALGDSMSIDRYPDLDYSGRERLLPVTGLGAASLLARNDDHVWPEFAGRDLLTRYPGIECRFLAALRDLLTMYIGESIAVRIIILPSWSTAST